MLEKICSKPIFKPIKYNQHLFRKFKIWKAFFFDSTFAPDLGVPQG